MECANCHDHPLDRWKQDDYHGLAAVFARIDRKQTVRWLDRGAVTNRAQVSPRSRNYQAAHAFLQVAMSERTCRLDDSAPDSHLAKATVNRVWSHFFGRGLVEPVDDMRLTNPATHPQLLQSLTASFIAQRLRSASIDTRDCAFRSLSQRIPQYDDRQPQRFYVQLRASQIFIARCVARSNR